MTAVTTTVTDIRDTLPLAVKGGTASKPVWSIEGQTYKFVKALNKKGLDAEASKPRLGKRILAKYKVKTTSPTVKTGELEFVGMFKLVSE